jgi:hypothetical protein
MNKNHFKLLFVLAFWLIINLLTAANTELLADEAYYWLYGSKLSWGYFDHPPLIAFYNSFIDRNIWHSELSVRLIAVLSCTSYIWVVYEIFKPKNIMLFLSIALSTAAINVFGFVSVPDTPLLLLSALFYLFFIKYSEEDNWKYVLGLGIVIPLMFYTKYHAVLIVFFSLLSNLELLKRKSFYLIVSISLLLFMPHILWQINHDYPSIRYHLFERNNLEYNSKYTLDYLFGQWMYYGPVLVLCTLYYLFQKRFKVEKKYKVFMINYLGFLIFFGLSSFKGWVEVNWTISSITTIIFFSYTYVESKGENIKRWFTYSHLLMFLGFVFLKFQLVTGLFNSSYFERFNELRNHKLLADTLIEKTHGKQLCTIRYQEAALMSYYMQRDVSAINVGGRRNIFNNWNTMHKVNGQKAFLLAEFIAGEQVRGKPKSDLFLSYYDSLPAFKGIEVEDVSYKNKQLILRVPKVWVQDVLKTKQSYTHRIYVNLTNGLIENKCVLLDFNGLQLTDSEFVEIRFDKELKKGEYKVEIYLKTLNFGVWSEKYLDKITID